MSYRKISDINETIKVSSTILTPSNPSGNSEEKVDYEQPMTFSACPKCNYSLKFCSCSPENYYCLHCGWEHLTHGHGKAPQMPFGGYGNVSQNSLIAKAIRN